MSTTSVEVVVPYLYRVRTSVFARLNTIFISSRQFISRQPRIPNSRNASLIFVVSSLLGYLQIRSQGNGTESPFQTHPKTINVAVTSLLLYGLAYDMEQRFSQTHPNFAHFARRGVTVFGSLLMASLASMLFPNRVAPVIYVVYILFYVDELMDWFRRRFIGELEEIDALPV